MSSETPELDSTSGEPRIAGSNTRPLSASDSALEGRLAEKPKLTAVIPCYNHGKYLAEAVSSVLSQHYVDTTVIIVDDGSTDPATISEISRISKVGRVIALRVEHGGPGAARNAGLSLVPGEFALLLDADDRLLPSFAASCLKQLSINEDCGVASTWIETFGAATWNFRPKGGGAAALVQKNECGSMAVIRMDAWREAGGYPEDLLYEDWGFYLGVVAKGWKIIIVQEFLAQYRLHANSRNPSSAPRRPEAVASVVRAHLSLFQEYVVEAVFDRERIISELRNMGARDNTNTPEFGTGSASHRLQQSD